MTVEASQPNETPADSPEGLRRRWLAFLFLAACLGLSGFFISGDAAKGSLLAAVVMVLFTLLFFLAPRLVDASKPLFYYYLIGVAVVIGPLLGFKYGAYWTPWYDLQDAYEATTPASEGLDAGHEVVLVHPTDEFMVKPYSFRRANTSFSDAGVHLELAWPMSLVYKPLWFPVQVISKCRPSDLDSMYTSLTVARSSSTIEVLDAGEQVLHWCGEKAIGDGREKALGLH